MFRLLRWRLGRTLLRAAGRRCGGCTARLLPERAGDTGPGAGGLRSRGAPARGQGLLPLLAAFAWFARPTVAREPPEEEDAADEAEAEIIRLLKRAKMANLAFIRGQLENAEQLFKATMSYLLGGGMKQEDNAIIEISLKLASIYAAQNKQEFALAGYEFCIATLEEKIEREKELAEDVMSVEEKANTYLLLGMSLDACARYLLFSGHLSQAQRMYEKALQICQGIQGERHPQTIVLMSDLATTLDAQGRFDDAYIYMQRASDLAREINHPELHMVLSNLAAILTHRERYTQAKEIYQEALQQAELKRDEVSVQHIREELAELSRKSRLLT
ncbi:tetratricopeptide repeat protein 19, mitochondrial isoform X2 [Peromyscus leucopus]|uniref:tetratricopeptide repeat protein 19, mitochondrial isoform X2 n=1 Tax=Peromyscus leucopus TaxID=10041 RepID=UPI0010A194CE|nr:tetratricopeptide repeat protein 19, mitochondrial isoform X2 [Peromyscus leucopus]